MRHFSLAFIFLAGICTSSRAATTVACIGDSITAGANASGPAFYYPAVLGGLMGPGFTVTNYGVSGATMLGPGFGNMPYVSQANFQSSSVAQPNIVVIMLGTNDSKPVNWANKAQFEADTTAMVTHYASLASKPQVYLCLPCPATTNGFTISGSVIQNEIIPILRTVAANTNTPLIDVFTAMSGNPALFSDGVHPNDGGYNVLAHAVFNALSIQAPGALGASVVSANRVDLAWTDNASNESGFTIERKVVGGGFVKIGTAAANATSYSDTTAAKLTDYFYRVRAFNTEGESPFTNEAAATTPDVSPAAPTGLSASAPSATQIDLTWTDAATNESGFKIERKTSETGTYTQIATVLENMTSFSDVSLAPVTTYFYRIRASNEIGDSTYSAEASATTLDVPPAAPSDVVAIAASNTQVDVSWSDQSANETGFSVERSSDGVSGWTAAGTTVTNTTSLRDSGLAAATPYFYRVKATNAAGDSAYSNSVEVTTFSGDGAAATPPADSDGDGFSDSLETAAGSSPLNASDTPTGAQGSEPQALADVKLGITLNFAKAEQDSIGFSSSLLLSSGFNTAGQRMIVDIGGVAAAFTLDKKSAAKTKTGSASIKSKGVSARIGKCTVKLGKGDFAATLAAAGLTNATATTKVYVRVSVLLGGQIYESAVLESYKATQGKSGSAK